MPEITRETVTTNERAGLPIAQTSIKSTTSVQGSKTLYAEQAIYYALGTLEILLSARFILKLLGASQSSGFVRFIYGVSNIFIAPFEGIFRRAVAEGIETASIIEPATLVALIVYAILAWGIVSLIRMLAGEAQS